jgi:hypothetical protein
MFSRLKSNQTVMSERVFQMNLPAKARGRADYNYDDEICVNYNIGRSRETRTPYEIFDTF